MCVCFTLLEDFSTLLNHNLATTTTTTSTLLLLLLLPLPASAILLLVWIFKSLVTYNFPTNRPISTVFDLLQNSHIIFSKEGHVRRRQQEPAGSGTLPPPPIGLHFYPFYCKTSVMFLWLFFRYKTRYQRPKVIEPLWPCLAESPIKKLIIKKITRTILLIIVITVVIVLLFYFPKKFKKKMPIYSPHRTSTASFLLTTVYIFNTYFLTEGFLLCKEAAVTLSKIKYMFLKN